MDVEIDRLESDVTVTETEPAAGLPAWSEPASLTAALAADPVGLKSLLRPIVLSLLAEELRKFKRMGR